MLCPDTSARRPASFSLQPQAGPLRSAPSPHFDNRYNFMVASSAWVPALAPAGKAAGGPPLHLPGRTEFASASIFPSEKRLYGAKRRPAPRGPCESAPSLSLLTCLIQLFIVSASSAWVPALAQRALARSPFLHLPGELNSPGIHFPSENACTAQKRRPARAPAKAPHPLTSDMPDTVFPFRFRGSPAGNQALQRSRYSPGRVNPTQSTLCVGTL